MSVKVYNIIWADDEWATLESDKCVKMYFAQKGIEVLKYVSNSVALSETLRHYADRVDAVIVDGNFSKEDVGCIEKSEAKGLDLTGLVHTTTFMEIYKLKREIPFFLYTARKTYLQEIFQNGELDIFGSDRIFLKGRIEELANAITTTVDHINSIEHQLASRYKAFLDEAKELDDSCGDELWQFLVDEAQDISSQRCISMFTNLRKIIEQIMNQCRANEITPPEIDSLNQFGKYWKYATGEINAGRPQFYRHPGENCPKRVINNTDDFTVMPPHMMCGAEQLINILQDGSHNLKNMKLYISEYVSTQQTPFLFRSCLYQVMEFVHWYIDLTKRLVETNVMTYKTIE